MLIKLLNTLLVLITLIFTHLESFSQEVLTKNLSISFNDLSLQEALLKIEEHVEASFVYKSSDIPKNHKVRGVYESKSLESILSEILGEYFEYRALGDQIVLAKKERLTPVVQITSIPSKRESENNSIFDTVHVQVFDTITTEVTDTILVFDTLIVKQVVKEKNADFAYKYAFLYNEYLLNGKHELSSYHSVEINLYKRTNVIDFYTGLSYKNGNVANYIDKEVSKSFIDSLSYTKYWIDFSYKYRNDTNGITTVGKIDSIGALEYLKIEDIVLKAKVENSLKFKEIGIPFGFIYRIPFHSFCMQPTLQVTSNILVFSGGNYFQFTDDSLKKINNPLNAISFDTVLGLGIVAELGNNITIIVRPTVGYSTSKLKKEWRGSMGYMYYSIGVGLIF